MGHLEGNFTPVLYIGRKVPKGYKNAKFVVHSPAFRAGKSNITSVYKMQAFRGVEVKICSFTPPAIEGYFTPIEMTPGSQ